jgi:APA family basic amino acid/polyamine antiporter
LDGQGAAGAGTVFSLFIGFDAVSTAAQKQKNQKECNWYFRVSNLYNIICLICVMTGLVPYNEFTGDAKPAATAFARTGYTFTNWFNHCYFSGYLMLVVLMGQSRVFYTMSKDGLLHSLVTFTQNSEHHGKQIFSYLLSLLSFGTCDLGPW